MVKEHKRELKNGSVVTVREHYRKSSVVSSHLRKCESTSTVSGPAYKEKLLTYELENGVPYSDTDSVINEIRTIKLVMHCTVDERKVFDIQLKSVGLPQFEKYIGDIRDCYNQKLPLCGEHQRFINLHLPAGVSVNLLCENVNYTLSVPSIDI